MADNSSISSPSLDYCGVQTPESSPHGSPLAGNEAMSMRANHNNTSADLYNRYNTSSPRAFYNQNYTSVSTVGSPGMDMTSAGNNSNNSHSKKNNGALVQSSSLRDTIKSLPTPEMSPVEGNEKAGNDPNNCQQQQYANYGQLLGGHHKQQQQQMSGQSPESMHSQMYSAAVAFQQQQQYSQQSQQQYKSLMGKSGQHGNSNADQQEQQHLLSSPPSHVKPENPFSELVSRFSGSSSFLRNVCPPYAYRMQSRESIEEMQRCTGNYLMAQKQSLEGQFDSSHSRSMLQQHLEQPDSRQYRVPGGAGAGAGADVWPNPMPNSSSPTMYDHLGRPSNHPLHPHHPHNHAYPSMIKDELGGMYAMNSGSPYGQHESAMFYGHMVNPSMESGGNFGQADSSYSSHPLPYGSTAGQVNSEIMAMMAHGGAAAGLMGNNFESHGDLRHAGSPGAGLLNHNNCDSSNSELIAALAETREIIS